MTKFAQDIKKFNQIYRLPINETPTMEVGVPAAERLAAFKDILCEELDECNDIARAIEAKEPAVEILTSLADWLGDIQVYCASEGTKFGVGVPAVSKAEPSVMRPSLETGTPVLHQLMGFKMAVATQLSQIDTVIQSIHANEALPHIAADFAAFLQAMHEACANEMQRFGLPNAQILDIIMQSNFSKLGADGQPIYDERGKVMKGPNYWKPEPKIKALIESMMVAA